MEIILIYTVLFALFVVAMLFAYKTNRNLKLYMLNTVLILVGVFLIIISKERTTSFPFFALFLFWSIIGIITYHFGSMFSEFVDKLLCKLSGQQYELMKDDSLDDRTPETGMKVRYYIITITLYILFLMAVIPTI